MQDQLNISGAGLDRPPATSGRRLQQALKDREQFLMRHPHMRTYQAEIDKLLDKSGSHQSRLAVIGTLMQTKLFDMQKELCKLNEILHKPLDAK
jgi:hypothetical protein